MTQATINLRIVVDAEDADEQERDTLARQLVKDLQNQEGIAVDLARDSKLPEGALGDPITIGTILVALGASAVTGLIGILAAYLSRDERRSASLQISDKKLDLTGLSKEEQAKVIEWFRTAANLKDIHYV